MNIRRGEVAEVVSFYSYLDLPHDCVRVCTGPVCDCLGARELLAQAEELAPSRRPRGRGARASATAIVAPVGDARRHDPAGSRGSRRDAQRERRAVDRPRTRPTPRSPTTSGEAGSQALRAAAARTTPCSPSSRRRASSATAAPASRRSASGRPSCSIRDRACSSSTPTRASRARSRTATSWSCGRTCSSRGWRSPLASPRSERAIVYLREEYATCARAARAAIDEFRAAGLLDGIDDGDRHRRRLVRLRRGDRDARVARRSARHAAAPAAVPCRGRLSRAADADQQRRDARARPRHPPPRRRVVRRASG